MKKSRVLISVLFTVLLGAVVVGCDKGDGISNPVNSDNSENAYQALLDEAASGATVTLPKGTVPAGTSIKITKPLTVDGNNLEGLAITVSSSVADKVLLKNFKKAVVKVGAAASTNEIAATTIIRTQSSGSSFCSIVCSGCTINNPINKTRTNCAAKKVPIPTRIVSAVE